MKIYFTGSLHNKDIDKKIYKKIIRYLEKIGNNVKADHILFPTIEDLDRQTMTERMSYYKKLDQWISQSDLVVCEVSYPSTLNIGHEVSLALDKGKPVLALYKKNREPGVLVGISSERLILMEYSDNDLEKVTKEGLSEASDQMDVRFNFFISPRIGTYLDWISKNKKTPRAVYLRKLIEEDMSKSDYEKKEVKSKIKARKKKR